MAGAGAAINGGWFVASGRDGGAKEECGGGGDGVENGLGPVIGGQWSVIGGAVVAAVGGYMAMGLWNFRAARTSCFIWPRRYGNSRAILRSLHWKVFRRSSSALSLWTCFRVRWEKRVWGWQLRTLPTKIGKARR